MAGFDDPDRDTSRDRYKWDPSKVAAEAKGSISGLDIVPSTPEGTFVTFAPKGDPYTYRVNPKTNEVAIATYKGKPVAAHAGSGSPEGHRKVSSTSTAGASILQKFAEYKAAQEPSEEELAGIQFGAVQAAPTESLWDQLGAGLNDLLTKTPAPWVGASLGVDIARKTPDLARDIARKIYGEKG